MMHISVNPSLCSEIAKKIQQSIRKLSQFWNWKGQHERTVGRKSQKNYCHCNSNNGVYICAFLHTVIVLHIVIVKL